MKPVSRSADEHAKTIERRLTALTSKLHAGRGIDEKDYQALCGALRGYATAVAQRTDIPKGHARTLSMILPLLIPFSYSYTGEEAVRITAAAEELEQLVTACLDEPPGKTAITKATRPRRST